MYDVWCTTQIVESSKNSYIKWFFKCLQQKLLNKTTKILILSTKKQSTKKQNNKSSKKLFVLLTLSDFY
jgi:hypothetical protein